MKQNCILMTMGILLILLGGCASVTRDIRVNGAADKSINFAAYNSYTWLGDQASLHDPFGKWQPPKMDVAGEIRFLIDREMQKRGYQNYARDADLAVIFFIGVDMEAMQLKTDPSSGQDILNNVPAAGLTVALIDTKTDYVVWTGRAMGDLQESPSNEVVRERLGFAISEMFKQMPKND